jgi:hypothetical protein
MRAVAATALALALLSTSTVARADVVPSDTSGCSGKARGSACSTDNRRAGHCSEIEVSHPRYGPKGPDGSWTEKVLACIAPEPEQPQGGLGREGAAEPGNATALMAGGAGTCVLALTVVGVLRWRQRRAVRPEAMG